MVLSYPLSYFYRDVFGWNDYSSIMQASRVKGLHTSSTGTDKRTTLVIPAELRALYERHKANSALAEAVRQVREAQWERKNFKRMQEENQTETAKRIFGMTRGLIEGLDDKSLVLMVWLLRRYLKARHFEYMTRPEKNRPGYERKLEQALLQLEKQYRS